MLQGRNPDWAMRPFFAKYDEQAIWLSDLRLAFGQERFFFEEELEGIYGQDGARHPSLNAAHPACSGDLQVAGGRAG